MYKFNRQSMVKLAVCGIFAAGLSLATTAKASTKSEGISQDQQVMASNDIVEIDLNATGFMDNSQKGGDVISGIGWLYRKADSGVHIVYRRALRPLGQDFKKWAGDAQSGAMYIRLKVKNKAISIEQAVVKDSRTAASKTWQKAIKPYVVTTLAQVGKLALVDGAYGLVLKPVGEFVNAPVDESLSSASHNFASTEKAAAGKFASDARTDAQGVYNVVIYPIYNDALRPIGDATATAGDDAGRMIGYVSCEYANSFRDDPKSCAFQAAK